MKLFGMTLFESKQTQVLLEQPAEKPKKELSYEQMIELLSSVSKDTGGLWEIAGALRNLKRDRPSELADFQQMMNDPIISSVLEMYADDSTQVDAARGSCLWVESTDPKLQKELNSFLTNVVDINSRIWTWAYQISLYGELFLRTFEEEWVNRKTSDLKERYYFEEIDDPSSVLALEYRGKNVGYILKEDNSVTFLPPTSYIHFISDKMHKRQKVTLTLRDKNKPTAVPEKKTFTVRSGNSFINNARGIWKVVRILEDSLMLTRLAKAVFFRIVHVEVGRLESKETLQLVNDIKRRLKSKEKLNLDTGLYSSDVNPVPINDFVYIPTREGKGAISMEPVGGDVNIKDIADIEYFSNKLYGAVRVPKTFLGFEGEFPGTSGATLTKLDLRYARSVRRIQAVIINGVKTLCDYYLMTTGKGGEIGNYVTKMTTLDTTEMTDFLMDYQTKVAVADQLWNTFTSMSTGGADLGVGADEVASYIWTAILGISLEKDKTKKRKPLMPPGQFGGGGGGQAFGGGGGEGQF